MSFIINGVEYNLSVKDVAERFDYSEGHVRILALTDEIRSVKRGRQYRFNLQQVTEDIIRRGNEQPVSIESERGQNLESAEDDIIFDDSSLHGV